MDKDEDQENSACLCKLDKELLKAISSHKKNRMLLKKDCDHSHLKGLKSLIQR